MVDLETRTDRRDGVTLVEGQVANDGPDHRRIRLESDLDGPIWPPRREGVPDTGWDRDEGTLTVTLAPGERYGFGFASPAAPADPPVAVALDESASPTQGIEDSAAGVVRALGDPSPPVDAVPAPPRESGAGSVSPCPDDADEGSVPRPRGDAPDPTGAPAGGYPAVSAWLDAVEGRIERSADGESPPAAGERPRLAADADRLRSVARRAVELAERADECRHPRRGRSR